VYKTWRFKKNVWFSNFFSSENQWPVYIMACCWNFFSINLVFFFYSNFKMGILNFFRQNWIAVFWNMKIFESPCFNTWRFQNLHGLNTEIFEFLCFNTRRFKNLHVLKHGGFVSKTVHIFESPCFNTWRFKHLHV